MLQYLDGQPSDPDPEAAVKRLETAVANQVPPVVRREDFLRLAEIESSCAEALGVEYFKFNTNQEMFEAMGLVAVGGD